MSNASIRLMGEVDQFSEDELEKLKVINTRKHNVQTLNIFRGLRTQLLHKSNKSNFVCMVSSICPSGGASFVAVNLASIFALDKLKTSMVIDANLYSPSLDDLILGEASAGLTDYLSGGDLQIKDVVYATGIPRMRAIPIGGNSEGAAEYFSSEKMNEFISEVKERYSDRFIFIDGPPVLESSEARILTDIADMVVLVVPHGRVTMAQIESSIQVIGNDKLVGLIYNN